jgi:hypothetical protein
MSFLNPEPAESAHLRAAGGIVEQLTDRQSKGWHVTR